MGKTIRVLTAGIIGGALVFCAGAFNHMVLKLEGRAFSQFDKDDEVRAFLKARDLKPGLYRFPSIDEKATDMTKEGERWNAAYKEGPSGLLVLAPAGEDAMGQPQLVAEFVSNMLAALIAAWIVSNLGTDSSYLWRWATVFSLGLFTWLSTSASFGIWYRFPHEFIHDGLFCALIEWGVAGLVIAALVNPAAPASLPEMPPAK